jgi:hypothetical protein
MITELYLLSGRRIPDYKHKNTIPKINIFFLSTIHLFFYQFLRLPYLFQLSYLPSVFIQYFSPFLSLFLISRHPFHMCLIVSLSLKHILHFLSSPSIQYLLSLSSCPHLNLAIIFLCFTLSPPRYSEIFPLSYTSHTSCCIWIL